MSDPLPTTTMLFDGLCARAKQVRAGWKDVGHVWTQGVVFHSFVEAAPPGILHTCERPAKIDAAKHVDFVWTRGDSFLDREAELVLALESESAYYTETKLQKWLAKAFEDLDKILAENAPIGVLVAAHNHRPDEALRLLGERYASTKAQGKRFSWLSFPRRKVQQYHA